MLSNLELISDNKRSKSISFRVKSNLLSYGSSTSYIDTIKEIACKEQDHNIRICFHECNESALHQMLIFERRESIFYPPHTHEERDELHYVFEGDLEVHLLDDKGESSKSILNHQNSDLFTSVKAKTPHLTRPRTKYAIYLEIKNGPLTNFEDECIRPSLLNELGEQKYLDRLSKIFE